MFPRDMDEELVYFISTVEIGTKFAAASERSSTEVASAESCAMSTCIWEAPNIPLLSLKLPPVPPVSDILLRLVPGYCCGGSISAAWRFVRFLTADEVASGSSTRKAMPT